MSLSPEQLKQMVEEKKQRWEQQSLRNFIEKVKKVPELRARAKYLISLRQAIKMNAKDLIKIYGPLRLWATTANDFNVTKDKLGFANCAFTTSEMTDLTCDYDNWDKDREDRASLTVYSDGRILILWRSTGRIMFPEGQSIESVIDITKESDEGWKPVWYHESVGKVLDRFVDQFDKFEKKFLKYVSKIAKL